MAFLFLLLIMTAVALASSAVGSSSGGDSSSRGRSRALPYNHPRNRVLHSSSRSILQQQQQQESSIQSLRQELLADYDKNTFPFDQLWDKQRRQQQNSTTTTTTTNALVQPKRTGLPIEVGLNFHRVFEVDVTSSTADLIVWVRQRWNDPRLQWDPSDHDGLDSIQLWVGDGSGAASSSSEIWTPDVQLWNSESPLDETLVDAHAVVTADETVFWSRPGHVKPVCKFEGLEDFPFETLGCTIEIGSWAFSGMFIRPTKMDGIGYTVGGSETAGEAFAEFSLGDVHCEEHIYPPYPTDPEADWPVLLYHVAFQRSWKPYARGYLFLQVILNICAFCSFWLPPHIGERMGLNITAMLAAVASELVVAEKIPAATELTWFAKFSLVSLTFATCALIESSAVIYFHYHTGDDLVPKWYKWIQKQLKLRRQRKDGIRLNIELQSPHTTINVSSEEALPDASAERRSVSFALNKTNSRGDPSFEEEKYAKEMLEAGEEESSEDSFTDPTSVMMDSLAMTREEVQDANNLNGPPDDVQSSIQSVHGSIRSTRPGYGGIVEPSLRSLRTRKTIKTILGRDADDFKNAKEMKNNLRWQKVAHAIDDFSRIFFPVAFSVAVMAVLSKAKMS